MYHLSKSAILWKISARLFQRTPYFRPTSVYLISGRWLQKKNTPHFKASAVSKIICHREMRWWVDMGECFATPSVQSCAYHRRKLRQWFMIKRERLRSALLRNLSVHTIKLLYRPPLNGTVINIRLRKDRSFWRNQQFHGAEPYRQAYLQPYQQFLCSYRCTR